MAQRALLALFGVAGLSFVLAADKCQVSTDVTDAEPYKSCNAAVNGAFDFQNVNGQGSVSQKLFCTSSACAALWNQLDGLGQLFCLKYYNTDKYKLWKADDTAECFANKGENKPLTTSAPSGVTITIAPDVPAPITITPTPVTPSPEPSIAPTPATVGPLKDPVGTVSSTGSSLGEKPTPIPATKTPSGSGSKGGNSEPKLVLTNSTNPPPPEGKDESGQSDTGKNTEGSGPARTSQDRSDGSSGSGSQPGKSAGGRDDGGSSANAWVYTGTSGSAVIVVYLFVYVRRRNSKQEGKEFGSSGFVPTVISTQSAYLTASSLEASLPPSRFAFWDDETINAVRIPFEKLARKNLISRGGYGEVYRGTYRDEPVAIKTLLPERRKDMRQIEKFLDEVKLMAVLEHEHIVRFVGVAWDSLNELCVVSEFMQCGDLRSLLSKYEAHEDTFPKGFNVDKIKIALHVSHALTYMHSLQPMILHRDLKSRNILLDESLNAKLTDFGMSRERADTTMTCGVGSSLWMAPEVMVGGYYGEKADVFSFGVVLSELDLHSLPYSHAIEPGTNRKLPDAVIVQMMTTGRISVEFSKDDETSLAELGRRCVSLEPQSRPSAAEVQHHIHQVWRSLVVSL